MDRYWNLDIDDDRIAWLTFDAPDAKVNTFTAAALEALDRQLRHLGEVKPSALAILSAKRDSFIVGADIGELERIADAEDAKAKSDAGHWVFGRLAALPFPTVAVIHGACLGGGLEMALACDYRLVTEHEKTSVGLPEVNLGIIPGWGGTQRLPRLIGLAPALSMILPGKPVNGKKAHRIGLADGIVAAPFREEQTRRFLEQVLSPAGRGRVLARRRRRQTRLMRILQATPPGRALIYRAARREVMEKTKGNYPAPLAALDVIRHTYRRARPAEGHALETEAFADLACTPIARNLVHLFQASQRLKKGAGGGPGCLQMQAAGVVGAGIMGAGIAWALANAGLRVRLKDVSWDAVARGMAACAKTWEGRVKRRRMSPGRMNLAMHRIAPTVTYDGFGHVDVVVEAVVENAEIKKAVLAEIEAHVGPDTVICTNTSSLPLPELAAALRRPGRFVGLHFFNPVPIMPLVEVVPGPQTDHDALVAATDLVRRLGKTPIVVGDCAGFLVNRILLPYLIESAWMFEEGVEPQRIDALLERFGMPMGPLALVDEVGIDVGYEVARVLENAYGDRMHVPRALAEVVETGELLGKKNGRGFYLHGKGGRKPNPVVLELGRRGRRRDGIEERELSDEAIVDRAILIMVNEAARCLDEKVVGDPEALDMAMIMGTGFAPFRGGLLRYADARGIKRICERLEEMAETYGPRFAPAPYLVRVAGNGGRFYEHDHEKNGEHE